jgi:hypothetical protein
MISWGIVTIPTGFVQTAGQFYAARFITPPPSGFSPEPSQPGYFCTKFVAIDQQHNPTLILLQSIHRAATVFLTYCHGSERMISCLDELPDSRPLIAKC